MPPVSKAGGSAFRKDVEFVTKDDDEQIAAGIVMVPDKADLQNDFAREETIREFADQFETFVEAGEAGGGVMHAVFPDGWMDLERNEVLDEATEIGGTEAPAGAWVQEWQIDNGDLWELIADGILEGYSIGAIQVGWNGPFEQDADEVDDVAVPDALGEDALIWELVDGIIREVSAVDIPAVPDAQILETKADAEKRLGDYLGDRDGFVEEALDRGHSEAEAERLWDVLNAATEAEGSAEPGEKSIFHRIGKAAVDTFLGDPDASKASGPPEDGYIMAPTDNAPNRGTDKEGRTLSTSNRDRLFATIDASVDVLEDAGIEHGIERFTDRDEWGFDLSEHTAREWPDDEDGGSPLDVDNAKAVTKEDTVGVDVFRVRAADDDETDYDGDLLGMGVDFPEHDVYVDWRRAAYPDELDDPHVSVYGSVGDLEQATGNVVESLGTVDSPVDGLANMAQRIHSKAILEAEADADESGDEHAAGGETPDDGGTEAADNSTETDMTDDDSTDGGDGDKSLSEQNAEQIKDLTQAVENLTESLTGPEAKTAEIEIDGETYEVREDAAKAVLGVDEGSDIGVADAIERLNEKAARVDEVEDRLDTIAQQSGVGGESQQLEAAAAAGDSGEEENLDQLGKMLN
ncbi:XkdF-like putative serine protease domain-containing protein [Natrinema salsiterrestre]|uniref:XkdF-like putative serine protease domain-containing protein n=1 Tax=Natrinema salsiterrestre TaxID=2950540 RepID=A0A9Q4L693_9EURY|nr:XkdF-like putative serine protease domain-containing protein [Natrinema salsiterrestre]MDF9748372.1 XkdF-like putative serine protease domain-containing protein [Natrinema salsiterrestre]